MHDFVEKRNFLLNKTSELKSQQRLLTLRIPLSITIPWTPREAATLCAEYLRAAEEQDRNYFLYMQNFLRGFLSRPQTGDALLAFTLPFLMIDEVEASEWFIDKERKKGPVFGFHFVLIVLRHPNCPEELLVRACHHPLGFYSWAAAQHPNCPEADAVWAWGRHERNKGIMS